MPAGNGDSFRCFVFVMMMMMMMRMMMMMMMAMQKYTAKCFQL